MNKLVKWILLLTISWFLISFIIVSISLGNIDFPLYPVKSNYIHVGIINIITAIICLYLAFRLIKRHQRTEVGDIIIGVLVMVSCLNILQSVFQFWRFNVSSEINYEDPTYIFQQFFFNSSYYFLSAGILCFYYFIIEIFYDGFKNKRQLLNFRLVVGYVIFFVIYLLKFTLIETPPTELTIISGILLLYFMGIFILLIFNSLKLRGRLDANKKKEREGLLYFSLTGIFLISAFIFNLVFNILYQSGIELTIYLTISNISMLLAFICLYLGFVKPKQ